jgi:hypothetical protein
MGREYSPGLAGMETALSRDEGRNACASDADAVGS